MIEQQLQDATSSLADRYTVEAELDRGGMAAVFLAEDVKHGRKVAVKILLPSLAATLGTDRFLREIEVLAKLQHPHILPLIDSGDAAGLPYYVMPFVAGMSLKDRIEREGTLSVEEALRITREVADGLEAAHALGVIHRDVKPSNVLLSGGHAVVADFGIAAALEQAGSGRLTQAGTSLGSPIYMSPEQAAGEMDLDVRTDVYSLACVLYEMLVGSPPFADSSLQTLLGKKVAGSVAPIRDARPDVPEAVEAVLLGALATRREDRPASARAVVAALDDAVAASAGLSPRSRALTGALVVVSVALVIGLGGWLRARAEAAETVWASRQLVELDRLYGEGRTVEALALSNEIAEVVPEDTTLARLREGFSSAMLIHSNPSGARVLRQSIDDPPDRWEELGTTPLDDHRVEWGGGYRYRLELSGYRTVDLLPHALVSAQWNDPWVPVQLDPVDALPEEMVRQPGFEVDSVEYSSYFMDRYEVTNQAFKAFVDAGGYDSPEYWAELIREVGDGPAWSRAVEAFRDQTGRPGPSTWRLGTYRELEDDHPVRGVSWYEAAAYAAFVGKELPTVEHWNAARRHSRQDSDLILPRSNIGSDGPRPVGERRAMHSLGVYDLTGNVRECQYNRSERGRATRGGAWPDAPFHTGHIIPKDPLDRDETHGFRLVRAFDPDSLIDALRERSVERTVVRDYNVEQPVSDAEYAVFERFYAYDPMPLNERVERVDTFVHWVREKVSFDLPYGERGGVHLYLPLGAEPPYQTIVFWGGSGVLNTNSIDDEWLPGFDFLVRDGRAVALPVFDGAYERDDSLFSTTHGVILASPTGATYRDWQVHWVQDVSRSIDYIETRADLDSEALGFYGFSWGGQAAPIALAVEPRLRAAVLYVAGLRSRLPLTPEADPLHFVTRVTVPVKMINGEFDPVFPLESDQLPMYRLLGTSPEHKERYQAPSAHYVPRDELIRESLVWLDRYLGTRRR